MSLAIIIPAYKSEYLDKTLSSLANQTVKNFNVYIGNDCSPYPIKDIVDKYSDKLNITYQRFKTNFGGKDLVSQWERCVAMSRDEEWIWLFSDDDMMEETCVENFYRHVSKYPDSDIFHFNVNVIDNKDNIIHESIYPPMISSRDLYLGKIKCTLDCYVVEFIFRRSVYEEYGGFVNFDLAWGSDLATWVNFGSRSGIRTIPESKINWRASGENISTINTRDVLKRKTSALLEFIKWGESTFEDANIKKANRSGLLHRLANMAQNTDLFFGFPFIRSYSNGSLDYAHMSTVYLMFYLAKKVKNVFQR